MEKEEVFLATYDNRVRVTENIVVIDKKVYDVSSLMSPEIRPESGNKKLLIIFLVMAAFILFFGCLLSVNPFVYVFLLIFALCLTTALGKTIFMGKNVLYLLCRDGVILCSLSGDQEYIESVSNAVKLAIEEYKYRESQISDSFSSHKHLQGRRDTSERKITQRITDSISSDTPDEKKVEDLSSDFMGE
jgi:hypothetical protein